MNLRGFENKMRRGSAWSSPRLTLVVTHAAPAPLLELRDYRVKLGHDLLDEVYRLLLFDFPISGLIIDEHVVVCELITNLKVRRHLVRRIEYIGVLHGLGYQTQRVFVLPEVPQ